MTNLQVTTDRTSIGATIQARKQYPRPFPFGSAVGRLTDFINEPPVETEPLLVVATPLRFNLSIAAYNATSTGSVLGSVELSQPVQSAFTYTGGNSSSPGTGYGNVYSFSYSADRKTVNLVKGTTATLTTTYAGRTVVNMYVSNNITTTPFLFGFSFVVFVA